MKRTFLGKERPMTVGMIQKATAEECVSLALDSIGGGADAVGLQLESLPDTEKTDEKLRRILDSLGGKPCYFTNYRYGRNDGKTDETLAHELVHFTQLGGTLADIPGDFFDKSAVVGGKRENCRYPECTTDENAIAEQKKADRRNSRSGGRGADVVARDALSSRRGGPLDRARFRIARGGCRQDRDGGKLHRRGDRKSSNHGAFEKRTESSVPLFVGRNALPPPPPARTYVWVRLLFVRRAPLSRFDRISAAFVGGFGRSFAHKVY